MKTAKRFLKRLKRAFSSYGYTPYQEFNIYNEIEALYIK